MEAVLADDDAALVDAYERIEHERIGAGTHKRLHGMIEALPDRIRPYVASAPVGSTL